MKSFEPRRVPAKHMLYWLKGGVELASRKPITFVTLWVATSLIVFILPNYPALQGFVCAISLAISCLAAEAADRSESLAAILWQRFHVLAKPVLTVAACYSLFTFLLAYLVMIIIHGYEASSMLFRLASDAEVWQAMTKAQQFLYCFDWVIIHSTGFLTLAVSVGWFAFPLVVSAGVPASRIFSQSILAVVRNLYLAPSLIVIGMLRDIIKIYPVIGVPFIILMTCMAYLSYKDIWVGESEVTAKKAKPALRIKLASN